jgi:hypothetical protein
MQRSLEQRATRLPRSADCFKHVQPSWHATPSAGHRGHCFRKQTAAHLKRFRAACPTASRRPPSAAPQPVRRQARPASPTAGPAAAQPRGARTPRRPRRTSRAGACSRSPCPQGRRACPRARGRRRRGGGRVRARPRARQTPENCHSSAAPRTKAPRPRRWQLARLPRPQAPQKPQHADFEHRCLRHCMRRVVLSGLRQGAWQVTKSEHAIAGSKARRGSDEEHLCSRSEIVSRAFCTWRVASVTCAGRGWLPRATSPSFKGTPKAPSVMSCTLFRTADASPAVCHLDCSAPHATCIARTRECHWQCQPGTGVETCHCKSYKAGSLARNRHLVRASGIDFSLFVALALWPIHTGNDVRPCLLAVLIQGHADLQPSEYRMQHSTCRYG